MLKKPPGKIEFVRAEIGREPALIFVSAADGTGSGVRRTLEGVDAPTEVDGQSRDAPAARDWPSDSY